MQTLWKLPHRSVGILLNSVDLVIKSYLAQFYD
jgi:hypothetical protein